MEYLYALDVSMTNTGVAIFEYPNGKFVHKQSINTDSKELKASKDQYDGIRLRHHYNEINKLISKYPPKIVVAERGFTRFNTVTQILFRVHGTYQLAFSGVDYIYLTPTSIKKIVYKGNADKEDIRKVIADRYEIEFDDYDQSDAYSIGLAYLITECDFQWEQPTELTLKDLQNSINKKNIDKLTPDEISDVKEKIQEKKHHGRLFEQSVKAKTKRVSVNN